MGRVFASPRRKRWAGTIARWALLAGIAPGCGRADDGRQDVRAPGEVPWLGWCAEDADCADGQCLCGLCSTPCIEGACGAEAPPAASCLEPAHWLSGALCAGRSDVPLCMTACDAVGTCEAGFDCLDGFCVPSTAAAIAREQELIPVAPLCERDRVVWRSLYLERPEQVEALRGCERIEGNLRVDADEVRELSALGSLRQVRGALDILARNPMTADAVPFSLRGLEQLESVGRLRLASVAITSLAPLSRLRSIEGQPDSGLYLSAVHGLGSFRGLDSLERVQRIELAAVPDLQSWREREVESPDGRPLPELLVTSSLVLQGTALVGLDGLRVEGALEELRLEENVALEDIRALGGLREVSGPLSLVGSPLGSLAGLEALERVDALTVSGTALTNLSGLERLASAGAIQIENNPALTTLAGLGPGAFIGGLVVRRNPSLTQLRLGKASIDSLSVFDCPIADLSGLDEVRSIRGLTLEDLPNLTSLAGLQPSSELSTLNLRRCAALDDINALAGLTSLGGLVVSACGLVDLDALAGLQRLRAVELDSNPNLTQVDALASIAGLAQLWVSRNPSLVALPSFAGVVDESDAAQCGDGCGLSLAVIGNAALEQGPGFPALTRAADVRIAANASLTALGGFGELRSVQRLEVEGNPALAVLGLARVESASAIIVRGNAALPESELDVLRAAQGAERRIASNGGGPDRLDPCPWASDGVCDEAFEACAAGADGADCAGVDSPAWGSLGSLAP